MKLKHVVLIGVVSSIMSYLNNNLEAYGDDAEKQEQLLEDIRTLVNDKLEKFDVDGCLEGLKNDVPEHIEKAREVASDITESLIQELNGIIASFASIKNEVMEEQAAEETTEEVKPVVEETVEETVETPVEEVSEEAEEELDAEENTVEVPNDAFEDLIKTIEVVDDDEEDEIETDEFEDDLPANDDEIRNSLIAELEQLVNEIDLETSDKCEEATPVEETTEEVVEETPLVVEEETTKEEEIDERASIIADLESFLACNLSNVDEDIFEEVVPEDDDDEEEIPETEELAIEDISEVEDEPVVVEETIEEPTEEPVEETVEETPVEETSEPEDVLEPITDEMLENFSEDEYLNAIQEAINSSILFGSDGNEIDLGNVFDEVKEETPKEDKKELDTYDIDEIFAEILNQEKPAEETVEEVEATPADEEEVEESCEETPVEEAVDEVVEENPELVEETKPEETTEEIEEPAEEVEEPEHELTEDEYLDDLIGQLNDALANDEDMVDEEEVEETKTEEPDLYTQINQLYPYLSRGFVRAVYDLKETIANEYPVNHNVIILHRLSFKSVNSIRQFAEIVLSHDYRVNVDEKQMIIDILKECKNTDGKILTNIFEIANQASLLDGVYEGYRVEVID